MYIEFYIDANIEIIENLVSWKYKIANLANIHFHKDLRIKENWLALTKNGTRLYNGVDMEKYLEYWYNVPINASDFYNDYSQSKTSFIDDVKRFVPCIDIKVVDRERIWGDYYGN